MDRRRFLATAATAGLGATAGCSGVLGAGDGGPAMPPAVEGRYAGFQGGPRHEGVADGSVAGEPGRVWSFSEPSTAAGHQFGTPAVADGVVYVPQGTREDGTSTAFVTALDARSGEVEWEFSLAGTNTVDDAVLAEGTLLQRFGGVLVAIDADTGRERWRFDTDLDTTPTAKGGLAFVVGRDLEETRLYAIDVDSGETAWRREFELPPGGRPVQPAVADGVVYSVEWELVGLDAATGRPQWAAPTDRVVGSAPTVTEDTVYLSTEDSGIEAIDRETRERQWWQAVPSEGQGGGRTIPASPAVRDGRVFTTNLWALSALDAADGTVQWTAAVDGNGPPVVAGERVYVAGLRTLAAFAVDGGADGPVFTTDDQAGTPAAPAVVDGAVFFASDELHALAGRG